MNWLTTVLSMPFRIVAFFIGKERVVRFFIRAANNSGNPEIAALVRQRYFEMTGSVIRDENETE